MLFFLSLAVLVAVLAMVLRFGPAFLPRAIDGEANDALLSPNTIHGRLSYEEWREVDQGSSDSDIKRARYRLVVASVFPPWFRFYLDAQPDGVGHAGAWLLEVAIGAVPEIQAGLSVTADGGDLCVETGPLPVPTLGRRTGDPRAYALAQAIVGALPSGQHVQVLLPGLLEEVRKNQRAEALRLVLQHFAEHPEVEVARQDALQSDDPELRLTAACAPGREDLPTLRALGVDPGTPVSVRRGATATLGRLKDLEGLLAVATSAPAGVETVLAESLAHHHDPRVEAAVVPLLASENELVVERVAQILSRQGTVAAVAAARARASWASKDLRESLELAVELIQERAGPERAGALALVEPGPGAGAVSVAGEGRAGGLSLTVPAGALSTPSDDDPG